MYRNYSPTVLLGIKSQEKLRKHVEHVMPVLLQESGAGGEGTARWLVNLPRLHP